MFQWCYLFILLLVSIFLSTVLPHAQAEENATPLDSSAQQCNKSTLPWKSMQQGHIVLLLEHGKQHALTVKLAKHRNEIMAGYQYLCPEIIKKSAILFDFGTAVTSRFHMRNVFAPLDIAFFSADGELINTAKMEPELSKASGKNKLYAAHGPYRYALETPAGMLSSAELIPGATRLVITAQQ